jgi:hypothetical protein
LADAVIIGHAHWTRYSQQLLCWLNTLDSKASHLGGAHLLSPEALEVVAGFPIQIASNVEHRNEAEQLYYRERSASFLSQPSPTSSVVASARDTTSGETSRPGEIKHTVLQAILQPALQWYMTSQSYCRQISAYDKHHRSRFTSDDEFVVITACKRLETQLLELWDVRPAVISLNHDQLTHAVSLDLAIRLQEVFAVYLASYWVLFVHLHRVSWWSLPHSALTKKALEEVWQHLRQAYGQEVHGHLRKIVHPALLWPLFIFGTECNDRDKEVCLSEDNSIRVSNVKCF